VGSTSARRASNPPGSASPTKETAVVVTSLDAWSPGELGRRGDGRTRHSPMHARTLQKVHDREQPSTAFWCKSVVTFWSMWFRLHEVKPLTPSLFGAPLNTVGPPGLLPTQFRFPSSSASHTTTVTKHLLLPTPGLPFRPQPQYLGSHLWVLFLHPLQAPQHRRHSDALSCN
jgi:hypothetical protein